MRVLALVYAFIGYIGVALCLNVNQKEDSSTNLIEQEPLDEEEEDIKKEPHYSPKAIKYMVKRTKPKT